MKTSGEQRVERRRPAPVVQQTVTHQPRTPEQIEAFRQLIEGKPEKTGPRLVTKSVMGLAALSLVGWAWRSAGKKPAANGGAPEPPNAA